VAVLCFAAGHGALGQQQPVREVGSVIATAADSFSVLSVVRVLTDERVVVNDVGRRRLILLDATLRNVVPILDSGSDAKHRYPVDGGTVLPYAGDTSLFYDRTASALVVIRPDGSISRTIAAQGARAGPADPRGRMYYQGPLRSPASIPVVDRATTKVAAIVDSVPLIRVDLSSRRIDTVAFVRRPDLFPSIAHTFGDGKPNFIPTVNPRPFADAWTLLSDGTVAIVRAHDYHVDWVDVSGHQSASPKLAHEWTRIPDSATEALVDSLRQAQSSHPEGQYNYVTEDGTRHRDLYAVNVPDADQLPDYEAPFVSSSLSVMSDPDGNLWIQQRDDHSGAGTVYDVVGRSGRVMDRVRIPKGTQLVGLGHNVAYLSGRTGRYYSLVRVRVR
jgi:hypothetical protein